MATKTKSKTHASSKASKISESAKTKKVIKPVIKKKIANVSAKPVARRQVAKADVKPAVRTAAAVTMKSTLPMSLQEARPKPLAKPQARPKTKVKVKPSSYTPLTSAERRILRTTPPQFTYMKAPAVEHEFQVGDTVEVFCDHEKGGDRVRGWVKGIVVQVDNKLVAVQFRSNVFLTDGWMVPDRILWYPLMSDQIRDETTKRSGRKEIPDY